MSMHIKLLVIQILKKSQQSTKSTEIMPRKISDVTTNPITEFQIKKEENQMAEMKIQNKKKSKKAQIQILKCNNEKCMIYSLVKYYVEFILICSNIILDQTIRLIDNQQQYRMDSQVYGPVLLVCIYNKYGNIITHDYFYQLFSQYGEIVKILIFQKAKVWKTFIQFTATHSAKVALDNLNNHVVFEDGSKMNIFPSKLKHIKLQNSNLGGVNYQQLKNQEENIAAQFQAPRNRSSTYQEQSQSQPQPLISTHQYHSNHENQGLLKGSAGQLQSTFSIESYSNKKKSGKSYNTFDIDEQFLELARQSQQFRQLQREENLKSSTRRKAKTIVTNPHLQQFVLQNSPSKVLFIRSIPACYTNKCLYNIFRNFGNVVRVIYMKDKGSGLVQFQTIQSSICAKDQLNYAKADIKIFYSHYQTLSLRKQAEGQEFEQYNKSQKQKPTNINPPSEVLYLTMVNPTQQDQIRQQVEKIGCSIGMMDWKQNGKDRWMCLADFGSIQKSLMAMGFLQGLILENGKQLKLSFTRSKISNNKNFRISQ